MVAKCNPLDIPALPQDPAFPIKQEQVHTADAHSLMRLYATSSVVTGGIVIDSFLHHDRNVAQFAFIAEPTMGADLTENCVDCMNDVTGTDIAAYLLFVFPSSCRT